MEPHVQFYDPRVEIEKRKSVLLHWEQPGASYFVTFRLGDSVPKVTLDSWSAERAIWMDQHPKPWSATVERAYHERFSGTMERWLDRGHGKCVLRRPDVARIVRDALAFFDNERCVQHTWVVMPNHVHALFTTLNGWALDQLLHSWKSFTSNKINVLTQQEGPLWQADYFDRLIRDGRHFWNCARYIHNNPLKTSLRPGEYILYEAEWLRERMNSK